MIIKATRVQARGPALSKLIKHVENADDNDVVLVLRGTTADLMDARADARSFGRQYCVRHWIVSPSREISFEKMLEAVDKLGAEFHFDPARAVVRGHRKPKAVEGLFDGHIHVLVPEVDPVSGGVMSSSHDWLRGEKVAKILSFDWREPFVESSKPAPILAALRRDGRIDVAKAYQAAFPEKDRPRPFASFDTAAQQRLKRHGLDLPALRVLVAGAVEGATSRAALEANLQALNLVCKSGDKPGVFMVETAAGETVGSLARLAKVKKSHLLKIMEPRDARAAEKTDLGASHVPEHADTENAVGADQDLGGSSAGYGAGQPAWDGAEYHGGVSDERPDDDREAGRDHRTAGSTVDQEGRGRYAERLRAARDLHLALGLVPYLPRLHRMLAKANRMALSPDDKAIVGLSEIEDDARSARAAAGAPPPEPSSLHAARTALTNVTRTLEMQQSELDGAKAAVRLLQQRRPWWQLAIGLFTGANHRRAHELRSATARQSRAQAALVEVKRRRSDTDNQLAREVSAHRQAVNQHVEHWTQAAKAAEEKAAAAPQAYELLKHLPGAVRLGAVGLCGIASKIAPQREGQSFEVDDYTAVPFAAQP